MSIIRGHAGNGTVEEDTWMDILPENFQGCEAIFVKAYGGSHAPSLLVAVQCRAGDGDSPHRFDGNTPLDSYKLSADGGFMTFYGDLRNKITRVMVAGVGGTAGFKWSVQKA